MHGEKANTDTSGANDWKVDRLQQLLKNFSLNNILNTDETGLYYEVTADISLGFKMDILYG